MSRGSPWPMKTALGGHGAACDGRDPVNAASRVCRFAKRPLHGRTVGAGLRFASGRSLRRGIGSIGPSRLGAIFATRLTADGRRGLATRPWPAGDLPPGGWRRAGAPQRAERVARDQRFVREDAGGSRRPFDKLRVAPSRVEGRQDPPGANPFLPRGHRHRVFRIAPAPFSEHALRLTACGSRLTSDDLPLAARPRPRRKA